MILSRRIVFGSLTTRIVFRGKLDEVGVYGKSLFKFFLIEMLHGKNREKTRKIYRTMNFGKIDFGFML